MKKLMLTVAVLFLTGLFTTGALAADTTGLYLSGKLVYGYTQFDNVKVPAYERLKIGDKNDNAFGGALAVGYDFYKRYNVPLRAELEYSVFSNVKAKQDYYQADGGEWIDEKMRQKYNIQTLFINAYYDFHNSSAFTPYVGAGLGLAFIDSKFKYRLAFDYIDFSNSRSISSSAKLNTNFAFNLNLGTAYAFTENLSLDAGYRFASLGSAKTQNVKNTYLKTKNIYMHQFYLGARYTF